MINRSEEDSGPTSPRCNPNNTNNTRNKAGLNRSREDTRKHGNYLTAVQRWWKKQCPLWEQCVGKLEIELKDELPTEVRAPVAKAIQVWKMELSFKSKPRTRRSEKCMLLFFAAPSK